MNAKKNPMDNYKRFLLNRSTTNTVFVEFVENLLAAEDVYSHYTFHKIMIHNWNNEIEVLFDTMTEYFSAWFIPIDVATQKDITTFYTSSLNLILRLTRLDFMFPFERNMFNVDVIFNDKTSADLFGNDISVDDIVSGVVSGRFDETKTLDLSDLSNDQEFREKKLSFYKVSLLSNFRILMLRVGRDTASLNLSYNQLVQPPLDVMNFFIKGDLTQINLSYNKITSISDLVRVTSKIEKLWVEGNPLCEDLEPSMFVKHITMKFPRLTELDGIKLNEFGLGFPFCRNFMVNPTKQLKMVVEKFLTIYFSHYDTYPRTANISGFYDDDCSLSVATGFTDAERKSIFTTYYAMILRNLLYRNKKTYIHANVHTNKQSAMSIFADMPISQHDPTTFTVDLLRYDKKCMILVVDGIFKDLMKEDKPNVFSFRRTFIFNIYKHNQLTTVYKIKNEMFYLTFPTDQQLANCFKHPIRNMNTFELINPEKEDTETLVKIFCRLTQLKKDESERRLKLLNWDLKKSIREFVSDFERNIIDQNMFMEEDTFSDSSSLIDDEMVD